MKTVVTKYETPLMRSSANPRRYNDSFARMLAAVAAASFVTISGPAATKLPSPATMQSNQQVPAILACRTGDSCLKRIVISDLLIVVPPYSYAAIKVFRSDDPVRALREIAGASDP